MRFSSTPLINYDAGSVRPAMAISHDRGGGGHILPDEIETTTILSILSNPLLLSHTVDYLPISATLNLAAASRVFRGLVYQTPRVLRHLDLSLVRSAQFDIEPIDQGGNTWRNVQLDENVTEDDFYAGPLRGIFAALRRRDLLRDVSTLILDGLSVTAELVHDIISEPSLPVRILSLREVKNLNEPKLRAVLQMAVRPSRPEGTPRLRGLYIFGAKEPPSLPANTTPVACGEASIQSTWNQRSHKTLAAALNDDADNCPWYERRTVKVPRPISREWASTILACAGVISFDGVLCRGPWHLNSPAYGTIDMAANAPAYPLAPDGPAKWAATTQALDGCAGCGSAPEGWTVWGESGGVDADDDTCRFPLLAPPPLHSSNVTAAKCPNGAEARSPRGARSSDIQPKRFIARCVECLRDRCCWNCSRWWCEKCYTLGQMDSHDGLYYEVRDGLCIVCELSEADRTSELARITPAEGSTEANTG